MRLATYRHKRDFRRTSEPRGKTRQRGGFSFVVQKHAARSLHYDFRLELDGVLLSWAVPKGPSLDPSIKRLAVQTEDHPLEYGKFEGLIPKGEYGAGSVEIWDRGQWVPDGDARENYQRGRLSFELRGKKLHGGFNLVRTKSGKGGRNWLLMKRKDVADGGGRRASGNGRRSTRTLARSDTIDLTAAPKAKLPAFVAPQLATLVDRAPSGDAWLHEIKLDGYRMQLRCDHGKVTLLSRGGHDWTSRVPSLLPQLASLRVDRALFDGELVVLHEGVSDFQRLQNSLRDGRDSECVYYAFDLLYVGDHDVRSLPQLQRKALLAETLKAGGATNRGRVRLSEHVVGNGEQFFQQACRLGAEGSVAKNAEAPYASQRTRSWLKVKCSSRQEFVIGGFTEPSGARKHFGALLLGLAGTDGLIYAGKVGTGFTQASLAELHAKLTPLERSSPAFTNPPRGAEARGVHWVAPELVAEIEYSERTQEGLVRHSAFHGLREDKPARDVHEEAKLALPAREVSEAPKVPLPALRSAQLTHPDRVLYADQGITKADLALYYAQVAEVMLPHVANRPLTLVRCPEGEGKQCFFQKHPSRGLPPAIHRIAIREKKGTLPSMFVDDAEGLVALVQMGALEIHTWGSRISRVESSVEFPDQLTFDLDPDQDLPWPRMIEAATLIKQQLEALDLPAFLKTTGGKGLHVVVPIEPKAPWDDVAKFCKAFAQRIVRDQPDRYVATVSKAKRKGKILIDYLRNTRGATAVCAYSTRARPGAPVATPIAWSELTPKFRPDQLALRNLPARIATGPDAWRGFGDVRPRVTHALLAELSRTER